MSKVKSRRCAIYTRKSTEEGLEQDFNSLDAQREACAAYIRSQAGEGWKLVGARYDDGGYSGGNLERRALSQLLTDIQARKIDTVVVYKVDRLTRSLADFAKIVEIFDRHGVSFVSVTQQFNTTTSMGRLTLNMLLSFAQFEREVTGERIRDKIAASKKKGMWMGGVVPLGYEPDGRTLKTVPAEAETVRRVYDLYLEHGNVRRVKSEADQLGFTTKTGTHRNGRRRSGCSMTRGYIYKLLSNPLYAGRIAHGDQTYEGLHPAIIDQETWEAVQTKLAANGSQRSAAERKTEPSPLMGKLYDERGIRLTPSHAVKKGRRYRYYVSRDLIEETAGSLPEGQGWRLPAQAIEDLVRSVICQLLDDPAALAEALRRSGVEAERLPGLLATIRRPTPVDLELVERVDLAATEIAISLSLTDSHKREAVSLRHAVPITLKRRGVEMRLVLASQDPNLYAKTDPALIRGVIRARRWFEDLATGRAGSVKEIAEMESISDRYISALLPLAFLAPEIVEAILKGAQPADLTLERLMKRTALPYSWAEQKALLGFD